MHINTQTKITVSTRNEHAPRNGCSSANGIESLAEVRPSADLLNGQMPEEIVVGKSAVNVAADLVIARRRLLEIFAGDRSSKAKQKKRNEMRPITV